MKKYMKIISILFIVMMMSTIFSQVYAGNTAGSISAGDIIEGADGFITKGEENADDRIDPSSLMKLSDSLYNILLVVGIIAAIIVGLIMGIKFIMGSLEEKAEIKAMLIPYIIGCIVVFGAFTIWKIVVDLLQTM